MKAKHILTLATLAALPYAAAPAQAASYTWTAGAGTGLNWSTGFGGLYPTLAADTATIPPQSGDLTVNIDVANSILGTLTFGSTGFNTDIGNANSGGNPLSFNNTGGTGNASIVTTGNGVNTVSAPIILLGNTDALGAASTTGLTLGNVTSSGGARQLNNNAAAQTLTLNGTLFATEAQVGTPVTRGLVINGSGTGTVANGNVIVNGMFSSNGIAGSAAPITLGSGNTQNGLVRSTITLNADNSTFAGNITFSRANTVLTADNNTGTGRLLLGGSTNSVNAQVSSAGGTRTINNAQLQIQQFNAFTGTNSFIVNSRVIASASRGLGNLLSGGATLTLNNGLYAANTAGDARNQIIDGSGTTIINGGLRNAYDQTNNIEFATSLAGSYEKRGTGVLIINGTSNYTGGTRVRGGTMEFATSAAYGVGIGSPNGITVDAGGAVGLQTGSLDPAFLARIALGGGSNFQTVAAGATPVLSTDFTSNGAIALTNNDTNINVSYATGGNLAAANLQGLSLGAVSTGANFAGTITPAASTYRLGGGGTLALTGTDQLNGANGVVANNGGTVAINTAQSYTGTTTVGGVYINPTQELLRLGQTTSVITNPVSLRANSTVSTASLANGGVNSGLGSSSNAAANLVLNGGTLRYTGAAASTDRLFTVTANGATLDASGSGAVDFSNTGAIVFADAAGRAGVLDTSSKVTLYVSDANDLAVGMTVTGTGIAAGSTIRAIVPPSFSNIGGTTSVGPYQVILSANATGTGYQGIPDLAFGGQNRKLTLTGSNTAANTIAGALSNSAAGTLGIDKTGAGTWVLSGNNTQTGATTVSAGTLVAGSSTGLSAASAVTVGGGASVATLKVGTTAVSTIPSLTIASNGRVDVGVGTLVIENGGGAPALSAFAAQVATGRAGGSGVFTSAADASHDVGYIDTGTGIKARYVILGDANLDGAVNFNDFLVLQTNFGAAGAFYGAGDFNYDGTVNFNDFLVLQTNFGQSLGYDSVSAAFTSEQVAAVTAFGLTAAVPEPASLALIGLGAAGLVSRRRRAR